MWGGPPPGWGSRLLPHLLRLGLGPARRAEAVLGCSKRWGSVAAGRNRFCSPRTFPGAGCPRCAPGLNSAAFEVTERAQLAGGGTVPPSSQANAYISPPPAGSAATGPGLWAQPLSTNSWGTVAQVHCPLCASVPHQRSRPSWYLVSYTKSPSGQVNVQWAHPHGGGVLMEGGGGLQESPPVGSCMSGSGHVSVQQCGFSGR